MREEFLSSISGSLCELDTQQTETISIILVKLHVQNISANFYHYLAQCFFYARVFFFLYLFNWSSLSNFGHFYVLLLTKFSEKNPSKKEIKIAGLRCHVNELLTTDADKQQTYKDLKKDNVSYFGSIPCILISSCFDSTMSCVNIAWK